MIHLYDKGSMVYTVCWQLPLLLKTTADRRDVTCPRCLFPRDAGGQQVLPGVPVLLPNGKAAMVDGTITLPLPEVVVIFRGEQVTVPAAEVILL